MIIFFNNCRRRNHAGLFGAAAFFDLNCYGRQATMATDLQREDECVVATPDEKGDITFSWFTFSHEEDRQDADGKPVRVLFGNQFKAETLSRAEAIQRRPYSAFFNINGHFKQLSVIRERRVLTGMQK